MGRRKQLDDSILIPLLVRRSYHIPGNNVYEDWTMWFRNNHIVFGICLHHKLHPLETWERILQLLASTSFGLVATSLVYEAYSEFPGVMGTPVAAETLAPITDLFNTRITVGAILLWTAGGFLHSLFDMLIWHVMACACCHPGGQYYRPDREHCKDIGSYMLIPIIVSLLMVAAYFVLLRATRGEVVLQTDDLNYQEDQLENIQWDDIQGIQSFSFLFKYGTELLLAWFVYFPILGSLFFSGILGCNGKIPILGGRPRDMERIRREQEEGHHYRNL